jgi:predicted polyphosphate/ATP-dependent NAD kinase
VIKRLFGKSAESTEAAEPLASGRLITSVDVRSDRSARGDLSDAEVERIALRMAEHLLQGSRADLVTRVVERVAERLVRQEIDRIRAAAQPKA